MKDWYRFVREASIENFRATRSLAISCFFTKELQVCWCYIVNSASISPWLPWCHITPSCWRSNSAGSQSCVPRSVRPSVRSSVSEVVARLSRLIAHMRALSPTWTEVVSRHRPHWSTVAVRTRHLPFRACNGRVFVRGQEQCNLYDRHFEQNLVMRLYKLKQQTEHISSDDDEHKRRRCGVCVTLAPAYYTSRQSLVVVVSSYGIVSIVWAQAIAIVPT